MIFSVSSAKQLPDQHKERDGGDSMLTRVSDDTGEKTFRLHIRAAHALRTGSSRFVVGFRHIFYQHRSECPHQEVDLGFSQSYTSPSYAQTARYQQYRCANSFF